MYHRYLNLLCASTFLLVIELLGCSDDGNAEDGKAPSYKWCEFPAPKGSNISSTICYEIGKTHRDFKDEELSEEMCAVSGSLVENKPSSCLDKSNPKWCVRDYDKINVGETPLCYEIGAIMNGTTNIEFTEMDCKSMGSEEMDKDNIPSNCEVQTK
jgi:hypothetical protein